MSSRRASNLCPNQVVVHHSHLAAKMSFPNSLRVNNRGNRPPLCRGGGCDLGLQFLKRYYYLGLPFSLTIMDKNHHSCCWFYSSTWSLCDYLFFGLMHQSRTNAEMVSQHPGCGSDRLGGVRVPEYGGGGDKFRAAGFPTSP